MKVALQGVAVPAVSGAGVVAGAAAGCAQDVTVEGIANNNKEGPANALDLVFDIGDAHQVVTKGPGRAAELIRRARR